MALETVIAGLATELTLDQEQFSSGLADSLVTIIKWGGALTAAAGGALAFFTEREFMALDATAKFGAQLGVSGDEVRAFELGMERAGLSLAVYERAALRIPKTIGNALQGLSTQVRAFETLGLDPEALSLETPEEQFVILAEAISQLENESVRAAIANDIFGRSGQRLLPFLSKGREGIEQMRRESERLNGAFTDFETSKIEEANDSVTEAGLAFSSIFKEIALQVAPLKENFFDFLADMAVGFREEALPGIMAFVEEGLVVARDAIIEWGPIAVQALETVWSGFEMMGRIAMIAIDPVLEILGDLLDALGLSSQGVGGWANFITEALIGIQFGFQNWERIVNQVVDGVHLEILTFNNEVIHFFTETIPAALEFFATNMDAVLNNLFFDLLEDTTSFADEFAAIITNLPDIIAGNVDINTVLAGADSVDAVDRLKLPLPEFQAPERQIGFVEDYIRREYERGEKELDESFEEFRKKQLEKIGENRDFLQGFFDDLLSGSSATGRGGDRPNAPFAGIQSNFERTSAVRRGTLQEFEILQRTQDNSQSIQEKQLLNLEKANELAEEGNLKLDETKKAIEDIEPITEGSF